MNHELLIVDMSKPQEYFLLLYLLFLPAICQHPHKALIFFGNFLDNDVSMLWLFTHNSHQRISYLFYQLRFLCSLRALSNLDINVGHDF
jgi:hypothetical protein